MSDLIKRSDAIEAIEIVDWYHINRNGDLVSGARSDGTALYKAADVYKALEEVPSADRPKGKWIFHYRDKWMVKAECPKCHRRFEFSPRWIWKCCPMCETRMKGADNEADNN